MSGQYQYIINTLTNVNNKHILYNADFYWKQMSGMDKYCNFWIANLILSKPRNFDHLDHTTLFFSKCSKIKISSFFAYIFKIKDQWKIFCKKTRYRKLLQSILASKYANISHCDFMFQGTPLSQILSISVSFQDTVMDRGAKDAQSNFVMKKCSQKFLKQSSSGGISRFCPKNKRKFKI